MPTARVRSPSWDQWSPEAGCLWHRVSAQPCRWANGHWRWKSTGCCCLKRCAAEQSRRLWQRNWCVGWGLNETQIKTHILYVLVALLPFYMIFKLAYNVLLSTHYYQCFRTPLMSWRYCQGISLHGNWGNGSLFHLCSGEHPEEVQTGNFSCHLLAPMAAQRQWICCPVNKKGWYNHISCTRCTKVYTGIYRSLTYLT